MNFLRRQAQRFMDFISVLLLCLVVVVVSISGVVTIFMVANILLTFVINILIQTFHVNYQLNLFTGGIVTLLVFFAILLYRKYFKKGDNANDNSI